MSTEKDFFELLNSLSEEQTYTIDFYRKKTEEPLTVKFKQLSTSQLKDLIKTAVDSPLTQAVFNSTATKIFKQSNVSHPEVKLFNVIDRLLFLLETRIQIFSPTRTVTNEGKTIEVDYRVLLAKLKEQIQENLELFEENKCIENKVSITYGIPFIDTEVQIEEELYKNANVNIENIEDLRKIIGETFINEVAKSLHTVTINENTINLSTVPFKKRLDIVEKLPATLIQNVIDHLEKYKMLINNSLTVDGYVVPVDSTLFSVK